MVYGWFMMINYGKYINITYPLVNCHITMENDHAING